MEVQLKEKQLEILNQLQTEKRLLQAEYEKVTVRESQLITVIAESAGVTITPSTKVSYKEGGILVFIEDKDPKKPTKKTK